MTIDEAISINLCDNTAKYHGDRMMQLRRILILVSLAPLATLGGSCLKSKHPSKSSDDTDQKSASRREEDLKAALLRISECLADADRNFEYWDDAQETVTGLKAECPVVIMKMRHRESLLGRCRELLESPKARGLSSDKLAQREAEIVEGLNEVQGKLLPDSKLMAPCKKWTAEIMARPVEQPPSTSIPDGRCPTYGQILRDARHRYDAVCAYTGSCRDKLEVSQRIPDPYDKTRCDTNVQLGRSQVFISALYRNHDGNWQLEAIK